MQAIAQLFPYQWFASHNLLSEMMHFDTVKLGRDKVQCVEQRLL